MREAIKLIAEKTKLSEDDFFKTFVVCVANKDTFETFNINQFGTESFDDVRFPSPFGSSSTSKDCLNTTAVVSNYNYMRREKLANGILVEIQGLSLGAYIYNKSKLHRLAKVLNWDLEAAPSLLARQNGSFSTPTKLK